MLKKYLLFVLILLAVKTALAQANAKLTLGKIPGAKPKNIIFILADDHRFDFMGFTKKVPWLETPNMDKMAREGVYVKNAFVTTALCSPSRASILSGQYTHTHTVVDNFSPLPKNLVFFPQYLQKTGYATAFFGKWHMGNTDDSPQPGFKHWESFPGQGDYLNNVLNINGKRTEFKNAYITDLLTEHALSWLKNRKADQPFFVYLSHKAVHHQFKPAPRHVGSYADKQVPYPPSYNTPTYNNLTVPPTLAPETKKPKTHEAFYGENYMPNWVKQQRESWHGVDYMYNGTFNYEQFFRAYCETIRGVDESIGQVLDYVQQNGLADNTLVVYMGDNGFSLGEHGLIDKRQFYEESTRVPLLFWGGNTGAKKGQVVEELVQNTDITPTFLQAAGLVAPAHMQGKSFYPLLEGKKLDWRNKVFYEYFWEMDFPQTPTTFGVRDGRYKYIRYYGIWDTNEFYDLQNDPNEMHNLIHSPEHQQLIAGYVKDLYGWLESTNGLQIPLKVNLSPHNDHRNKGTY